MQQFEHEVRVIAVRAEPIAAGALAAAIEYGLQQVSLIHPSPAAAVAIAFGVMIATQYILPFLKRAEAPPIAALAQPLEPATQTLHAFAAAPIAVPQIPLLDTALVVNLIEQVIREHLDVPPVPPAPPAA